MIEGLGLLGMRKEAAAYNAIKKALGPNQVKNAQRIYSTQYARALAERLLRKWRRDAFSFIDGRRAAADLATYNTGKSLAGRTRKIAESLMDKAGGPGKVEPQTLFDALDYPNF